MENQRTEPAAEADPKPEKRNGGARRAHHETAPPVKLAKAMALSTPKKKTARKNASPKKATRKSKPITMADLAEKYIAHLESIGKSDGTVFSYRQDLRVAVRHFGESTKVSALTKKAVAAFNDSDAVKKTKAGKAKATPTIEKTRRVLRLALLWAAEAKLIDTAPVEAKKRGRKPEAEAAS